MNFEGKVVLITGASSGIGAATAETFAKFGADVVIVGRNVNNLKATEMKCKEANEKGSCLPIVADVTTDAKKIMDETIAKFQRLDVLVNNAGIIAPGGILDADEGQFDRIMNTNLRAVFILTQLAAPHLIESQGSIVNVSSVAGIRSFAGYLGYGVSKAALDQFTKIVALELAPKNVRVNSVNPGVIVTNIHKNAGMSDDAYAQYVERSKTTHPLGRVGNVSEVAKTIAFLASNSASFITAAHVPIDGGKHAMCPR